ncbi:hypothetical protein PYW08_012079 [Mythimna loreyi]|uniref:Uncharacterized protein n=1 Tax=Mythimna loreyi TaxID=667449 RepID=A0ACC2PZ77_9NEOP|nr:hypothetical protein PYW08_012079 [Mythimna loreyi]
MMKEDYATVKQVDQLKSEVKYLSSGWSNVNPKRGAYAARLTSYECDSGPMGLPLQCNEQISLESTLKSSIHNVLAHQILEGSSESSPQNKQCDPTVELDTAAMTHVAGQLIESLPAQSAAAPPSVHCAVDGALPPSAPPVSTGGRGPLTPDPLPRRSGPATCTAPLPPSPDSAVVHPVNKNGSSPILPTTTPKQKSLAEIVREGKWKTQAPTPSDQWN